MATYFVSGHLDLTDVEFTSYYLPKLLAALEDSDARFVVGDAAGADHIAQQWLHSRTKRVTVYHSLGACLAAYRWTGGRLRNAIGGMDTSTEARISRDVQERWKKLT